MEQLEIQTSQREQIIDITAPVQEKISSGSWRNGAVLIFCPHTTCGLTINEGADPDVKADLMRFLGEIAPRQHAWLHSEGNSDAHIRSSLLGVSLMVPLEMGRLCLGRWQSIYLYEGDGPRIRKVWLQFITG